MVTQNQLARKKRVKKYTRTRTLDLQGCPQKKTHCFKIVIRSPKKPNSARRKTMRVYITSTKKHVSAYIPGIGHNVQKHAVIYIRGGRRRDIPGMKYTGIRGHRRSDFRAPPERRSARSKFGIRLYRPKRVA